MKKVDPQNETKKVTAFLSEFLTKNTGFYGKVVLNFHGGNVSNVNIEQSVKLEDKPNVAINRA